MQSLKCFVPSNKSCNSSSFFSSFLFCGNPITEDSNKISRTSFTSKICSHAASDSRFKRKKNIDPTTGVRSRKHLNCNWNASVRHEEGRDGNEQCDEDYHSIAPFLKCKRNEPSRSGSDGHDNISGPLSAHAREGKSKLFDGIHIYLTPKPYTRHPTSYTLNPNPL